MRPAFFALILLSCHFAAWATNEEHALPLIKLAINAMDAGYFSEPGNLRITQTALGENPTAATIEIEKDLADDAIAIEKTVFTLHRKNNVWVIDNQATTFKCREGRGHQTFSPACCQ